MPSATTASYEDDFVSERLLTFMHNGDYTGIPNIRGSFNGINNVGLPMSADKSFTIDKDGSLALSNRSNPVTCNSPITHVTPSYPAMPSPHLINKYTTGVINSAFTTPNPSSKIMDDYHSLQNSPFYNHYPMNGMNAIRRQNDSACSNFLFNGNGPRGDSFPSNLDCQALLSRRPPQRELFPSMSGTRCDNGWTGPLSSMNTNGVTASSQTQGLLVQDRIYYNSIAQKHGFIVGVELDRIKENCRRSTSHTYGRISAHFRNRYGETEAKTKAAYMQLGVRVPSKDHVSEIVGKGGQKIKLIREETGALITTPGEYEDHVFIIEAPPEIALSVADLIATRAQEITQSKLSANERRRGSTNSIPGGMSLFSTTGVPVSNGSNAVPGTNGSCGGRLMSRSPDDLVAGTLPSPSALIKAGGGSPDAGGAAFTFANGNPSFSSSSGVGGGNGRILLARSKISVPQDMVGKIIGTQGSIITTIQKDTGTEIKSPPKEAARGPSATSEFEISAYQSLGMTSNQAAECRVQQAKQLIGHLVMRQFERRTSEELEEVTGCSGKSRKNSTGEDCDENGSSSSCGVGGCSGPRAVGWMWPDVAQMDQTEAKEVLDRILAESKSKTRRAKELAAATSGSSVPPSPGAPTNGFGAEFFPPDKIAGPNSCQNSPFHRPQVAMPSSATTRNGYGGPAQVNLLNGFMSERILSGTDYHNENDHQMYNCSSSYWPNQHNPSPSSSSSLAVPRHSFSNGQTPSGLTGVVGCVGSGLGQQSPPAMLRRHTMASDHLLDHHHLMEDLEDKSNKDTSSSTVNTTAFDLIQHLDALCIVDDLAAPFPPGFDNHHQHRPSGETNNSSSPSNGGWPQPLFNAEAAAAASDGLSEGSANSDSLAMRQIWGEPSASNNTNFTTKEVFSSAFTFTSNPGPSSLGAIGDRRRRCSPPSQSYIEGSTAIPTKTPATAV